MRPERPRWTPGKTAALATTLILTAAVGTLVADPAGEPDRSGPERRPCCQPPVGNWQDFVQLEVRDTELILTNVSDRPIVGWMVRTVVGVEGNQGWGGTGEDRLGYEKHPDGVGRLLLPGESVSIPRAEDTRPLEDRRYPLHHDVGALLFENAEWVGVPEVVDRMFGTRVRLASDALTTLEAVASGSAELDQLPIRYQKVAEGHANGEDALRAVYAAALEHLETTLLNLRPEDLAKIPRLAERLADRRVFPQGPPISLRGLTDEN